MDTLSWIVVVIVTAAVFTAGHAVLYKRDAVIDRWSVDAEEKFEATWWAS